MKRVRVVATGQMPGSRGAFAITDDEGNEVHGVRAAHIHLEVSKPPTVELTLLGVSCEVAGVAAYRIKHPATGYLMEVARIEFADGSVWPPRREIRVS